MTDLRHNLAAGNNPIAGSADLALRRLDLTPNDIDRIARHTIGNKLDHQRHDDAHSYLTEHALKWILRYNPELDNKRPDLTTKRKAANSLIIILRLRYIDWLRHTNGDTRPGRLRQATPTPIDISKFTNGPSHEDADDETTDPKPQARPTNPFTDALTDAFIEPDFTDHTASRLRIERWQAAADLAGISVQDFVLCAADTTADSWLEHGAAA